MKEGEVLVYVDLESDSYLVGKLWARSRNGRESASFEYDKSWLDHPLRFPLEPMLQLSSGTFHTEMDKALFGAIGDSAPDRWGRMLMRRAERKIARQKNEAPKTLTELDYLLNVNDEARQGALRFAREHQGPFLAPPETRPIPPLVDLPKLLNATEKVLDDQDSEDDLKLLLAPGSSLGGARPKASVKDHNGGLAIAKFNQVNDEYNMVAWEAVALSLAEAANIMTSHSRLANVAGKQTLIVQRFDRSEYNNIRTPFISAMAMLGARDNEQHSYLEILDVIRQFSSEPKKDSDELYRRMVFNVLISNTDDHLRNHGFLYEGPRGWRLSPVYDVNPVPKDIKPRVLSTHITLDDGTASLMLIEEVTESFGLTTQEAKDIIKQVGEGVAQWRDMAKKLGIKQHEVERMSSAFEHEDLYRALNY